MNGLANENELDVARGPVRSPSGDRIPGEMSNAYRLGVILEPRKTQQKRRRYCSQYVYAKTNS
jgi:hypothetical protein